MEILEECGKADAGEGRPEQRYLWVQAIRCLGRRRLLTSEHLLPLLKHAEARGTSNDKLHRKVRDLVVRLVDDAAAGLKKKKRAARIQALLDLVIVEAVNPRVTEANRAEVTARIDKQLEDLKGHRGNVRRKNNVSSAILNRLLGFRMGTSYIHEKQDSYSESDGTAEKAQKVTVGSGNFGLRVGYNGGAVQPYLGGTYSYDYDDSGGTYDGRNTFGVSAGLNIAITDGVFFNLEGGGTVNDDVRTASGSGTMRFGINF